MNTFVKSTMLCKHCVNVMPIISFSVASLQALIGGLEGYGDIVSVSCTNNEIFLLKGDRDIIRISNRPEGVSSIGLYTLVSFLMEHGAYCTFKIIIIIKTNKQKKTQQK